MRKNFAIAICGIFAIICVGSAIGMFYVKTEPMNIDLMAALVGVLSILVTVLIGFQIANYFFAKDYLLKVINEKVDAKLGKITHTIKGYSVALISELICSACPARLTVFSRKLSE